MANVTRFDPFGDLMRFEPFRDMEEFWSPPRMRSLWKGLREEPEIRIDVTEDNQVYRVKADVPGVKKEDIHVAIDGNQVSITAESRRDSEEKKGETVVRSERWFGRQFRSFTLAHEIDQARAEAKCQDGILELTLPKKEPASAKQIQVK